ncbi:MAG: response regulator [bacterium]|nr:response regulator [bacterium]
MRPPLSVLIVEDSRTQAALLRFVLEHAGWRTTVAEHAAAALDCLHAALPDLIVCDDQMPGMSGLQLLHTVQQNPATRAVPFVLTTASDTPDLAQAALAAGARAVLPKPISPEQLQPLLATLTALSPPESPA